jgi:hypothetical protein
MTIKSRTRDALTTAVLTAGKIALSFAYEVS